MKTTSLKLFQPATLAALAIITLWGVSIRFAQAGYTVTLQEVGIDVVATGSGAIDLNGLTFSGSDSRNPQIKSSSDINGGGAQIFTGATSSSVDRYLPLTGPHSFGSGPFTSASSGSGDMVGIVTTIFGTYLFVPTGYVSDTALSDMAIYNNATFASLGVTPDHTYVWMWGGGPNQNFTLQILPANSTPTPTPCTGRCEPTPRPRPTPAPRP